MLFHIFRFKNLFDTIFICILLGCIKFCESFISIPVNLSTAKPIQETSPKPTTYRKLNDEKPSSFDLSSSPLDIFSIHEDERRSNKLDAVWKWDFWCQLQPKKGKCDKKAKGHQEEENSYYYDTQLDTCLTFKYSGCNGNQNNFANLVSCERHCKGSSFMAYKESSRSTYCGLQPNSGLCMDLNERYYYDVNTGRCKTFVYGGCGGNQNRFKTKSQCEEHCRHSGA